MRRYTVFILSLSVLAVLMMAACRDGSNGVANSVSQPGDTVYTAEAALSVYDYAPERALVIIDSAVIVGNVSQWWAEKHRARIYGRC